MKKKQLIVIAFSVVATCLVLALSMIVYKGPKQWISQHSTDLPVWVNDMLAFAMGGLVFYAGSLYLQGEAVREEHREQLEQTIEQAQKLEQENIELCDQLDQLEVQINHIEVHGLGDPAVIEEARSKALQLQKENLELIERVRQLETDSSSTMHRFQEDNSRLQGQLQSLETSHQENQKLLETVMRQVADLEQVNQDLNLQLQEKHVSTVIVDNSEELAEARNRLTHLERTNADLKVQLHTVEAKYRANEDQLNRAVSQVAELEQANAALYHRVSEMEVSTSGEHSRITSTLTVIRQLEEENEQLHAQIRALEQHNTESEAFFQRNIAQLEAQNRELKAQIEDVQVATVANRDYLDVETRRISEQMIETFRLQIEAQSSQMEAMNHALQYHRAELTQLRSEVRGIKMGVPAPQAPPVQNYTPPPFAPSAAIAPERDPEPLVEAVASYRANGYTNGYANGNGNGRSAPSEMKPIVELAYESEAKPSKQDDAVYQALLRNRLEMEERLRRPQS